MNKFLTLVSVFMVVALGSIAYADEFSSNGIPAHVDKIIELSLNTAKCFHHIAQENRYLERQITPSVWDDDTKAILQGTDYRAPIGATVLLWEEDSLDFEYFYNQRGIDLSDDAASALHNKLFSVPFDLCAAVTGSWEPVCTALEMTEAVELDGFHGVGSVILYYGQEKPIVICCFDIEQSSVGIQKSSIFYADNMTYCMDTFSDLCLLYWGNMWNGWKVDLS